MLASPRWAYLHGLGTGPASRKGLRLRDSLAPLGVAVELLDLRVPTPDALRLTTMVEEVRRWLDRQTDPVCLVGTSLGGWVALRAADHPAVRGVLLLAPALEFGELRLRQPGLAAFWRTLGGIPVRDKADRRWRWVGAELLAEAAELGAAAPPPGLPTSIVHGRQDRLVPVEGSLRFVARHPAVELVLVDDGHALLGSREGIEAAARRMLEPTFGR